MGLSEKKTIFSHELHERISRLAKENGISLGELVRKACKKQYGLVLGKIVRMPSGASRPSRSRWARCLR
jgi:hypothetical protein